MATGRLNMVAMVVRDLARSLASYRRWRIAIPAGPEGRQHVELAAGDGHTFFCDAAFVSTNDPTIRGGKNQRAITSWCSNFS